ncbi:phospholipase [Acinetobacter sp. WCHAc010034]|uniref:phospholipase A n=1 Tax=Acinetobacter sp. WCHAc010034 TaxID=1879049 RepID=UPI000839E2CB|nr:phospholipase A [Acinetobacter sp. WCHAc010034]AYA04680.1 phospholipase [Acinetobacter sp. WCHAc010034]
MAFTHFERSALQLGILLSAMAAVSALAQSTVPAPKPATPEACVALESNADRLACYDALYKIPPEAKPSLVSERLAAQELKPEPTEKLTLKEKVSHAFSERLFAVEAPQLNPNLSMLDRRWELSQDSKLGTWNIRSYQPVYLMPGYWTSDKNERPSSPNPTNTVQPDQEQQLKSMEAKFQLSLKTKAVENLFGDNGDVWVGYTQSSRWQVYNEAESRPFRETNYEPEASLVFRTNYELLGLNWRMLGLTLNHQSNGRSDPLSRSWNRVILNLGFERDNFALMLRPWYRIEEDSADDNNPDITDYVGRGDLTAFYRWKEHDFSLMLRHSLKGGDDSHGAVQFDWTFPISGKLRGQVQLFDGYGESLIDYNHRATYVGVGVSLMNWF